MIFENVKDAFNFYAGQSGEMMEQRAAEIAELVEKDAKADIAKLNIELEGIREAKQNAELRSKIRQSLGSVRKVEGETVGESLEREDLLASKEYRSAFYKTLLGHKLNDSERNVYRKVEERTATYNTTANSGPVLPTTTLDEIISKARKEGGLLPYCRMFNLPTGISIPIATPSGNAAWHSESVAVDPENATLSSVTFSGFELLKVFSVSAKVQTMSIAAFESYLADELQACVFGAVSNTIVNGTGVSQGLGLESLTWTTSGTGQNCVQVAAADDVEYADIVELAGLLRRGYSANAKFICNSKFLYSVLYSLSDTTKRPLFLHDLQNETVGRVLGFEVVVDDYIPDDTAFLGDPSYYGINLPSGIQIEVSRESAFRSGLIDFRALAVCDCRPLVNEAFVKLYKAAS